MNGAWCSKIWTTYIRDCNCGGADKALAFVRRCIIRIGIIKLKNYLKSTNVALCLHCFVSILSNRRLCTKTWQLLKQLDKFPFHKKICTNLRIIQSAKIVSQTLRDEIERWNNFIKALLPNNSTANEVNVKPTSPGASKEYRNHSEHHRTRTWSLIKGQQLLCRNLQLVRESKCETKCPAGK